MALLIQLHEQRGRLVTQAREALDAITNNTEDARVAELEGRHDTIMGELDALDRRIEREERQAQLETQEEERRSRQRPNAGDGEVRGQDGDDRREQRSAEQSQAEYRDAFLAMLATGGAVAELSNEQRQLLREGFVTESRMQTVGTNAAGGYTVPRTLANAIVEVMRDWGPMYDPGVTEEMTTSGGNPFDIPTLDDTGNAATALLAEGADPSNGTDVTFGLTTLGAYLYESGWLQISFELLSDSAFNVEALVSRLIGERLGRGANTKLTTGTGVNQPQGIVTGSTLGKTAASAAAIAADEMIDLQHAVNQAYRRSPKCRWMFADLTLAALRKLKDGQGNYLWQMGDVRANAPDVILGKPYSVNDDMPAIATGAKPVLFGDFSRYTVRKVGSPLIGVVRERFWPKVGLDGLIRYDGKLIDGNAIKHLKMA